MKMEEMALQKQDMPERQQEMENAESGGRFGLVVDTNLINIDMMEKVKALIATYSRPVWLLGIRGVAVICWQFFI